MKEVLSQFKKEVSELNLHISFLGDLYSGTDKSSKLFKYVRSTTKKKIDYKSLIISIYGLVENYAAQLVKSYLMNIRGEVSEYSQLRQKIRESHFSNSIILTSSIQKGKFNKFNNLNKEEVVRNLNNCIDNHKNYIINYEAFTMQTGNLTHLKICELFNLLAIDIANKLKQSKAFGISVNSENVFNPLDELVERRNQVAHGAEFELLGLSEVKPILDFVELYFLEIYKIVSDDFKAEIRKINRLKYKEINDYELYGLKNLFGFYNLSSIHTIVGGSMLIERCNGTLQDAIIKDIRMHVNNGVTIKLNKPVFKGNKLFIHQTELPIDSSCSACEETH